LALQGRTVVVVHRVAGFERLDPQMSRPHRVELAHHSGRDNGELPVTHRSSTLRASIRTGVPALAELIALGFIEMTPGRANPNPAYGRAARFRILYRASVGGPPEEPRRKRFKTVAEAKAARGPTLEG
jgi:hypothetical protein